MNCRDTEPIVRFSSIISSSIFSCPFFCLLLWDIYDSNVGAFSIVPEVSLGSPNFY